MLETGADFLLGPRLPVDAPAPSNTNVLHHQFFA
jgi:hypothetical protein